MLSSMASLEIIHLQQVEAKLPLAQKSLISSVGVSWKLTSKETIKAKEPVRFKQFGSIVRLKVTNNTGFSFKYNGVRIITSNILVGQFDLSSFDNVATSDLADTDNDNDLRDATSTAYKKVFKAFNFTQRATTDAKMTA